MAAEKYGSLKKYVEERAGKRGRIHHGYRDRLVEIAVEEFPCGIDRDKSLEVLQARMRIRIRQEYGSIIAVLLISVLANLIARAVWEWLKKRHSHEVIMTGWQEEARAAKG